MENILIQSRNNKLNYILSQHKNPYPERYQVNCELKDAKDLPDGTRDVRLAGRIILMRKMGSLSFVKIRDVGGSIQIAVSRDLLGQEGYDFFKKAFDLGDFIGACGEMFTTKTGEKTLRAQEITFLGKALRPPPEKYHGMTDTENRFRQRYLDLIMNEEVQKKFLLKFSFIREVRRYLEDRGYIEIETPVLLDKASGAAARPFVSHHNALDMDVYLRIAPETYLKRAIVGGFAKVFEFARCFRNEGMDTSHLQDFTMLEGYCAYYNYKDNMVFLQDMLCAVIQKLFGDTKIETDGNVIDFAGQWPVVTFRDLILQDCGIDISLCQSSSQLLEEIRARNIRLESETELSVLGCGNLIDLLYKKVSRPRLISPTFLVERPKALSPLARANDENPDIVDRFQLVINGAEVINAYSELVDPVDQKNRLMEQARLKAAGDDEAMVMDDDYIRAMEYGIPPISGWGIGVDRMLQVLLGEKNIRELILFPLMRPAES